MKVHFKVVCLVLVVLCLVAENESWWKRKSRSSRRSSSSSSSSSRRSSSSSRYRSSSSRSSRRRRGWFIRIRKPRVKPTVKITKSSGCQWRYGLGYHGCKNTASKTTTKAPQRVPTPAPVTPAGVSKTKAAGRIARDCITQLNLKSAIPSLIIHIIRKKPQCCIEVLKTLGLIGLAKKKSTSSPQPSVFQDVKWKHVKKLTTVERPFNDKRDGRYGENAITCLHRYGVKTSISGNPNTITHSGVLVTTEDDKTYLIHKMKGKNARVEYRPNLFDDTRWKKVKTIKPKNRLTINDYYNSIEPNKYNFWTSNCHHATEWMVQLAS